MTDTLSGSGFIFLYKIGKYCRLAYIFFHLINIVKSFIVFTIGAIEARSTVKTALDREV